MSSDGQRGMFSEVWSPKRQVNPFWFTAIMGSCRCLPVACGRTYTIH